MPTPLMQIAQSGAPITWAIAALIVALVASVLMAHRMGARSKAVAPVLPSDADQDALRTVRATPVELARAAAMMGT